ncbi:hypothetical protein BJX76DRAFT_324799 [Aspergillus varians]
MSTHDPGLLGEALVLLLTYSPLQWAKFSTAILSDLQVFVTGSPSDPKRLFQVDMKGVAQIDASEGLLVGS